MSKSKGKMKASPRPTPEKRKITGEERKARKNIAKNSVIIFWFTAIVLVLLFVGRWVFAIANGYSAAFTKLDTSAVTAVSNMKGLTPGEAEKEEMLPLQKSWDLFTSSRLCDEVDVAAADGARLHGRFYNEGSDVTVVVMPRFYQDGTADFLPGAYLHELTGCNILMPDPRMHGESGGEYFTYGVTERYDIAVWLDWVEETLGEQTFILWGEGTGANTILFAAADGLLPESVAFVVAESPYASLHELAMGSIWKWYSVPSVPFVAAIEAKVSLSAGFSVKDVDLVKTLEESGADLPVPVLFLHSAYDTYILPAWSESVENAYLGPQEVIVGGATHGTVYAAEQQAVNTALAAWWNQYGA